MKKNDYKTEFEEQRQEIDLIDKNAYSRVDFHSKNKKLKKGSRFSLVNILLVIFTLIPIGIFAFVIISLNVSKEPITPKEEDNGIQFETSGKPSKEEVALAEKEEQEKKEKAEAEEKALKEAEEQQAKAEAAAAAEEERKAEEARQAEAERQRLEAEEAERLAEQQRKEEEQKKEAARQQAEKEAGTKEQVGGKTHIVGPGETLYRISVNYYQTGDGVDKIKSANGLSSNSISEGQKLIIP